MTDIIFINEPILITQNTSVYGSSDSTDSDLYDYILSINVGTYMNELFNIRTYEENNLNIEDINVQLEVNKHFLTTILTSDSTTISSTMPNVINKSNYNTFDLGTNQGFQQIGLRLLEIIACKIFGHARARAAISNDKTFYNLHQSIVNGIATVINDKKYDLFNQYILFDRVQITNGYNDYGLINFYDTNIEIPMYLTGTIEGDDIQLIENGPDVGGNRLINGSYNIPILLRFYEQN